jgi:hypothetical protein
MNAELLNKIKQLEQELNETKKHLKKYTAPDRSKVYYENNKDKINNKSKQDLKCKEKRKEYNKISYLRRKEPKEPKEPNEPKEPKEPDNENI